MRSPQSSPGSEIKRLPILALKCGGQYLRLGYASGRSHCNVKMIGLCVLDLLRAFPEENENNETSNPRDLSRRHLGRC
jgi:hypothetical protein